MNRNPPPSTKLSEAGFSALLVMSVLLVLPHFGAVAMMLGSVIGLGLYVGMYPDRFRTRSGSLNVAIALVTALALAVALVLGWWLARA